ncbi:MAG: hypothetical protein H6822_08830 [Planctomycetaceae bacterium]|nr:hypothetical protein [Planctomycetales bacterium]MCB9922273.1 hypothetical protein [Planctomycetaceae bacterium]
MRLTMIALTLITTTSFGASIPDEDIRFQDETFQHYWGRDFDWKFDALPTKGAVSAERIPYSGYIYPDTAGGTQAALRKYDAAFHGRRSLATSYERWDTTAFQEPVKRRGGLFGLIQVTRMGTPHWHGHCNGWTSAAIRHAEPQHSVTRNGVSFSPAEIKALLAEIYIYNDHLDLSGSDNLISAGLFHAVLTNWLGRGGHPLGMESHPGEEKWNYPVYSFASSSAKRGNNLVEVKLNLASAKDSQGELDESPRIQKVNYFHYMLDLSDAGEIVGGYFLRDSSRIDMLWLPLRPKLSGEEGHERGNPHVNVNEVLAIWRESVPKDIRDRWPIADPAPEDRVDPEASINDWLPLQIPGTPSTEEDAGEGSVEEATENDDAVAATN